MRTSTMSLVMAFASQSFAQADTVWYDPSKPSRPTTVQEVLDSYTPEFDSMAHSPSSWYLKAEFELFTFGERVTKQEVVDSLRKAGYPSFARISHIFPFAVRNPEQCLGNTIILLGSGIPSDFEGSGYRCVDGSRYVTLVYRCSGFIRSLCFEDAVKIKGAVFLGVKYPDHVSDKDLIR